MAISLTRFAQSMWGGRKKEKKPVSKASASNSKPSSDWGPAKDTKSVPPHREVGRNREERRMSREYDDVVLVPSDDDCGSDWCLSGSESDDSDWSIGWSEPLGSDFRRKGDDGFAVLVPCYQPSCKKKVEASDKALLVGIKNLSNGFSWPKNFVILSWSGFLVYIAECSMLNIVFVILCLFAGLTFLLIGSFLMSGEESVLYSS
ncbi:hypothetical protein VNO78_27060 [Psophocarpus tetragonolobus]|uniref:Uncharacterized protein n=1 Tax=Psophocarpus tetragonolobus TaxID=3891 RepID=A0AAN9S046_PSOTE